MKYCSLILFALFGVALSACHRPFVEQRSPDVEIVSPDLSAVLVDPNILLKLRADSFRAIDRVEVNGLNMTYNAADAVWELQLQLESGINTLEVVAFDLEDVPGVDTVYAVHMPFQVTLSAPDLPDVRGGHTATLLSDGSIIVIGGARVRAGGAVPDSYSLAPDGVRFNPLGGVPVIPRVGHTATLLPDDRILILGGSTKEQVTDVADLVETVEFYTPQLDAFVEVPFAGDPIRRAYHTATTRNTNLGLVIDLYGGRGDVQYAPVPRLSTRRDLRSFVFRNDSLVALSPAVGPSFPEPIWGHIQVPVRQLPPGTPQEYLVTGTFFGTGFEDNISFAVEYGLQGGIRFLDAPRMRNARNQHAGVLLADGLVLISGGWQSTSTTPVVDGELFAGPANAYFDLPKGSGLTLLARYAASATKVAPDRILISGGFNSNGAGLRTSEFIFFSL